MDYKTFIILAITGLISLFIFSYVNRVRNNNKLNTLIKAMWGKVPKAEKLNSDEYSSIGSYFNNLMENNHNVSNVDNITWNDLDMDKVFLRMNSTLSTVGEEYLYVLLRQPVFDLQRLKERERVIQYIKSNPLERAKIQFILAKLGKKRCLNMTDYFYNDRRNTSWKGMLYRVLSCVAIFSPLLIIFSLQMGITVIILSFMTNMILYYKAKNEIAVQLESLSSIVGLVNGAKKIADLNFTDLNEYNDQLKINLKNVKRMNKRTFTLFYSTADPMVEYLKIAMLKELIDYESLTSLIYKHRDELMKIYEIVGLLDSLISVASYRESIGYYVTPSFEESKAPSSNYLKFIDGYHPLIEDPVANSFETGKSVLITGSNASGKSTFLKTTAINAIFAQTIHTCLAREYNSSFFRVFSSMALKDSLQNGESYYIAEVKSLKRIIDNLNDGIPILCFIDEILRGTNTIERISASSQVLVYLAKNNCLCMAATHDIELTHILKHHFDNYHFQEDITDNEITFDYKVYEGRSTSRNAIKLLKLLGYNEAIVEDAEGRAESFVSDGSWKVI